MECRDAQRIMWAEDAGPAVDEHVAGCPDCSLEAARMRQLATALTELRGSVAVPPPSLQPALLASLHRTPIQRAKGVVEHPRFWQGAAVAAAAAAGVVGILVARRAGRPSVVVPEPVSTAA